MPNTDPLFSNVAFRTIGIPFLLVIIVAGIEMIVARAKGTGDERNKYRAWTIGKDSSRGSKLRRHENLSIDDIRDPGIGVIYELEIMPVIDGAFFGPIGIDLAVGALAVDLSSTTNGLNELIIASILTHVLLLVIIVYRLIDSDRLPPNDKRGKKFNAYLSVALGCLALASALFAI